MISLMRYREALFSCRHFREQAKRIAFNSDIQMNSNRNDLAAAGW